MTSLHFTPSAAAAFLQLRDDPRFKSLLGSVRAALDALSEDPGAAQVRERQFSEIKAWGMTVRDKHEDWLIIWEPKADQPEAVSVLYLGADPFR